MSSSLFQCLHRRYRYVILPTRRPAMTKPTANYIQFKSEDAPALDALHSFTTSLRDGKIYVTANPTSALKNNKSRPPTLSFDGEVIPGKGVLIIGGGAGAIHAVESLREVMTAIQYCAAFLMQMIFSERLQEEYINYKHRAVRTH